METLALIRLLFLDADGTLIGAHNDVHPRAWAALDRARAAGIRLALCTGRPGVGGSEEIARRVDAHGVHAFQTGAVISEPGKPAVRTRTLPRTALEELVAISRDERRPLEAYGERRYFVERTDEITRAHSGVLGWEPEIVDLLSVTEPIVRAQWAVRDAEWPRLRALTERIAGLSIHTGTGPWAPGIRFANLVHAETSKADALRWIAAHHGVPLAEVGMAGDAENDVDAMAEAGLGIAMANAPEAVRAAADFVAGDVEEGGIAEAIDFLLAGRAAG